MKALILALTLALVVTGNGARVVQVMKQDDVVALEA